MNFGEFKKTLKTKECINLDMDRIRRDVYNAKKVWLSVISCCLWIFCAFKIDNIFIKVITGLFAVIDFWTIIKKTIEVRALDSGDFFIIQKNPEINSFKTFYDNKEIYIYGMQLESTLPQEGDSFVVFVKGIPVYFYACSKYCLSENLSKKLVQIEQIEEN